MEFDNIIQLIKAVSDSSLTGFVLEEGNMKLAFEKNTAGQVVQVMPEAGQAVNAPVQTAAPAQEAEEGNVIKSILVGVFYSAPDPEAEPFVKPGDTVKKGQILGIIEAMKLMNEIECDCDGIIEEVLVQDGDMVEYGQPIFRIKGV